MSLMGNVNSQVMSPTGHALVAVKREGVSFELLDRSNYQEWKESATIVLGLRKLWKLGEDKEGNVIDGKGPVPGYGSWLEIMAIVDSSHKKLLKGLQCGEKAWNTLEELYDTAGGSSTVSQLRELFQAKLTGSVFEFTTSLKARFQGPAIT